MKLCIIFIAGYIVRHIVGILFNRVFKPKAPQGDVTMDDIKDSVISYDRGKTWFIRTKEGVFVKVGYSSIQSILDFYGNQNQTGSDHTHADQTGDQGSKR